MVALLLYWRVSPPVPQRGEGESHNMGNRAASMFVLGYSVYYYAFQSPMSGFLQVVKYCSFTWVSCYFFFIMLGAVGFYSSLLFVRGIYHTLKID